MKVPGSDPPFGDIWLKFARAAEHLDALKASLLSIIEDDAHTAIKIELGPSDTWRAVVNLPGVERVDPEWSLLMGEILYQLRSILDHCVNAVVPRMTSDTCFPVLESEAAFDKNTSRQLEGMGSMERTVTKLLQPFWQNPASPRDSSPWALNELARLDRHRFIHTSGLWLTADTRIAFDPPDHGTIEYSMDLPGPLKHGGVIASGRRITTPAQADVGVSVTGVPDLVLTSLDGYRSDLELSGLFVRGFDLLMYYVNMAIRAYEDPFSILLPER